MCIQAIKMQAALPEVPAAETSSGDVSDKEKVLENHASCVEHRRTIICMCSTNVI